ncbi:MAG: DUF4129 domain-containing protein [Phycisphaerales bacterium]
MGFPGTRGSTGVAATLMAFALAVLALGQPGATDGKYAETPKYGRPDTQTIRDCAREILADPQFSPRKTFRQWLIERLSRWNRRDLDLPDGVGRFLLWAVISWCILALLAILIHLGWTIWMAVRRPKCPGVVAGPGASHLYEQLSFEQLWQKSRELARQGAFREAAGVLLIALLRRLEALHVLRFHTSKTNGEYLREYPGESAGRSQFVQFIGMFEQSIYGGIEVPRQTYETMDSLAQRIVSDVAQQPQI